jgi:hypothetical protein
MTDTVSPSSPLAIDRIQSSRSGPGRLRLRLSGRWLDPQGRAGEDEELLVVQVQGRRHRFPPSPDDGDRDADPEPGRWSATFTVPSWAEPRHEGQAALWLGNAIIAVPPLHGSYGTGTPVTADSQPSPEPTPVITEAQVEEDGWVAATPASARSGPLADLLLKETVAALHAELEERTADAAHLRGALTDAQSELQARIATQRQLEATLGELRGELRHLVDTVEDNRRALEEVAGLRDQLAANRAGADRGAAETAALREELAAATVSREAAVSEVAALRGELGRLGAALAITREQAGSESGDLGEATRLLADARALAEELRVQREAG